MDVNTTAGVRDEVITWVNSKSKDLDTGLNLMEKSGYKPHVCANFLKNRNRQDIPKKLEAELRLYLRYYANPTADIHKDEELEVEKAIAEKILSNIEIELAKDYPPIIKQLLQIYSDSYKDRSIAHTDLKDVGEANDEESMDKRKSILLVIGSMSLRQEALWKAFEAYRADGTLPEEELLTAVFVAGEEMNTTEAPKQSKFKLAETLEDLKKQSDGWRIKISKAGNRLNFQSEKKEDKPNPMPEGPKRITVEKHIERLTAEKLLIDTAIANMK